MSKEVDFEARYPMLMNTIITVDEFNKRVKEGEMLAVLDEYVVDLYKYINEHPGGRFSLE